jgi:hypothetical protein
MVHLRIVVPSYQAEHALDLLDATPSVCNLVYLERVALRPEGRSRRVGSATYKTPDGA